MSQRLAKGGSPCLTSVFPARPVSSLPRSQPAGLGALSGLSDRELLARVKDLVSQERAVTLEILVHLNRGRTPETTPRSRVSIYVRVLHPAPRLLDLGGGAEDPRRPVHPGLPGGLRASREERGEPEHRVPGRVDPDEGEQGRSFGEDPEQVAEGGRGDRGGLPAAGLAPGPGEAGVRGGSGTVERNLRTTNAFRVRELPLRE